MPDQPDPPNSAAAVRSNLHTIAQMLRQKDRLNPESQALLADLLEELSKSLRGNAIPSAEVAKLTECAAHLVDAVHHGHEPGLLEAAKNRLDRAVIAVESQAPRLADITRRLAQMLADVGI
jgi:hypothetical protein